MDTLAKVIQVTERTSGRDKLCRVVQYGSKFVSWLLEQESLSPQLVDKLRSLETSISTARKLFRLGSSFTQFRAALDTLELREHLLRFLVTLAKINRGVYLFIDHLVWAQRMKLISIDIQSWSRFSNRFWFFAIFLGLVRDVYELLKALREERERLSQYQSYESVSNKAVWRVLQNKPDITVDIIKNCADLLIPLSRLDVLYVPSGIVGLLGVISSLAGLAGVYNRQLKLKFS